MTLEQIENERAVLEAWASKGRSITHDGMQYSDDITEGMWQGWIIRAELEYKAV